MIGLLLIAVAAVAATVFGWTAVQLELLRRDVHALRARIDRLEHPDANIELHVHARVEYQEPLNPPAGVQPLTEPEPLETDSLETRIGGQWLLYIGVLAILVGIAYFEKLAFENEWMGPESRVVQAAVIGLALVYAGVRFARAGYPLYGQAISGAGIAIMYVAAYASFNFYHLVSRPVAFACMAAITAFGGALAERQASQGLAVLAVGGGFATPFLLPGSADAQVALFGYDAILAAGAAVLARRREWGLLYGVSYVLVVLTIAAWVDRFYTPAKYLTTELFLTGFCALFLYMLRRCRAATDPASQIAGMFLLTAPPAYYFASVAVLFDHPIAILVWLVAVTAAVGMLTPQAGALVGFVGSLAVAAPLLIWCATHAGTAWLTPGISTIVGIYAISLATQLRMGLAHEPPSHAEIGWIHLTGLAAYAAVYLLIDPVAGASPAAVAIVFAAWQGCVAAWLWARRRELATHFVGLAGTLVAVAIALQFNGAAITVGWGAEGFALVVLALRERRPWLHVAGLLLFFIACGRAEALLSADPRMGQLVLLNRRAACAAFLIVLAYGLAWLHASRGEATLRGLYVAAAIIVAQVLTLSLITSEIDAYWLQRHEELARQVMRSVSWAVYSTGLVLVGFRRSYTPIRVFAIVVLALTILKVFAVDLQHLQRAYRVVSVIVLGIMLLLTSYLYQHARGTAIGSARPRWPRVPNGRT